MSVPYDYQKSIMDDVKAIGAIRAELARKKENQWLPEIPKPELTEQQAKQKRRSRAKNKVARRQRKVNARA